jgi:hypothetical protein
MLDEEDMAATMQLTREIQNLVAPCSAIELIWRKFCPYIQMLYDSFSGVVIPVLVCNGMHNFREDSMVIDVGEPADWVKINVRQTVSSACIVLLIILCRVLCVYFDYSLCLYHEMIFFTR